MKRLKRALVLYLSSVSLYASEQSRAPRAEKVLISQVDTSAVNNSAAAMAAVDLHNVTLDDLAGLVAMKLDATPGKTLAIKFLTDGDLLPHGYTITKPGYYALASSVDVAGPSICTLRIKASNVVLDLNQHAIYQSGIDAGVDGIAIAPGLKNIIVKNGKISGVTGQGIVIGDGTHDIIISSLTVHGCGNNGISCHGVASNKNSDITLLNSEFTNNGGHGGLLVYTDKVRMSNTLFNNNALVGASFSHGSGHEMVKSKFCSNSGAGAAKGLELNDVDSSAVRNCSFNANSSTSATARGLVITGLRNVVEDCVADGNTTSAPAIAIGFDVDGSVNTLSNCSATANHSNTKGIGFSVHAKTDHCFVKQCKAIANSHTGFENLAPYGANLFVGNFSFGHGSLGNYTGAGIGFVVMGVAAQRSARLIEEKGFDNISVV
jgi:hypothetical protein